MKNVCIVEGCNNPTRSKNGSMCNRHEIQMRRHGKITDVFHKDIPGERWKNIDGYNGNYLVSNRGRVKSVFRETPRILKPCVEKKTGRLRVSLGENNAVFLDVTVLNGFKTNPYNDNSPCFKDGNKHNVDIENLEWMTSYKIKSCVQSLMGLSATDPDARAILGYVRGDDQSIAPILIRTRPKIISFLRYKARFTNLPSIDTEDIAHEALIRGMKAMRRGQILKTDKLDAWFKAIANSILKAYLNQVNTFCFAEDQDAFMDHAIYHGFTHANYTGAAV